MILHRSHRKEHPERPERLMAIYLNLLKKDLYKKMIVIDSEEAEEKDVLLAHSKDHVKTIMKASEGLKPKQNAYFAVDTYRNMFSTQAALISAGSTVEAVRAVCNDQVDQSFAIVRPPGHHAHSAAAGGFCFFNNVAVAARVA